MEITYEPIEFPKKVKDNILMIPKINKLDLEFINGNNILFKKTNLSIIEPSKIVISNDFNSIVIVVYSDSTQLYIKNIQEKLTYNSLSKIVLCLSENVKI